MNSPPHQLDHVQHYLLLKIPIHNFYSNYSSIKNVKTIHANTKYIQITNLDNRIIRKTYGHTHLKFISTIDHI